MNKNSNTLFGSKQSVKTIVEAEPEMMFGGAMAEGENAKTNVRFGYHKVVEAEGIKLVKGGVAGQIVFNKTDNGGVLVLGDEVISSKILNVSAADTKRTVADAENGGTKEVSTDAGVKTITIQYVDEADKKIKTTDFEVVNEAVVKAWIKALDDANNERLTALETYAKDTNITADAANAVKVVASDGDDTFKNYTVNLKIKEGEKVLSQDADGLASTLKLNLVPATGGTPAVLYTDAAEAKAAGKHVGDVKTPAVPASGAKLQILGIGDALVTEMDADDFLVNGMLETAEIHKTVEDDGTQASFLHLVWNTAAGSKETEINLTDLIDIENVTSSNTTYLTSAIDGGKNITLTPIVKTADEAQYAKPAVGEEGQEGYVAAVQEVTGIADAASFKKYIDEKSTNLAVTAEGDDYVSATVNADTDNKHVIVDANVADVTASAGTRGTWSVSDAGVATLSADEVAPSISGVEKTLVDGKQAIESIKTYVDAKVSIESRERAARIESAIKTLDRVETTSISDEHLTIKYSELDGIVTINASTSDIASAALLGTKADASTEETAFGYIAKEAALREQAIEALDASLNAGENIKVYVEQVDGQVTTLGTIEEYSDVTYVAHVDAAEGVDEVKTTFEVTDGGKLVKGSDLAKLKSYADDKIAEAVADQAAILERLDNTVKDEDDDFIKISIVQENGLLKSTDLKITYGTFAELGSNVADGADGLAKVSDVQNFVNTALTWQVIA